MYGYTLTIKEDNIILIASGQEIDDTLNLIEEAGFTGEVESTDR